MSSLTIKPGTVKTYNINFLNARNEVQGVLNGDVNNLYYNGVIVGSGGGGGRRHYNHCRKWHNLDT